MKKVFISLFITMWINSYVVYSQERIIVDNWQEYMEDIWIQEEEEEYPESLYTELDFLSRHPLDLNHVTEEELKIFPFLSDEQITSIIAYRKQYGTMLSIYELKNIPRMDYFTIQRILPFVYIVNKDVDNLPVNVDNLFKYGRNNLIIRYDRGFQQKKGYSSYPDSILDKYPNRKYLGEPFYHSIRYEYSFQDQLQIGAVGEKDFGEPFRNRYHKGYDFYSAHLLIKNKGWLKRLVLGDYKVSFGQGLVISHDFSLGKSMLVSNGRKRNQGFRRHFSTNEFDFLRGAGATLSWNRYELSLFYSYRKMDANVEDGEIRSLISNGIHRLPREREKMRIVPLHVTGGNVRYNTPSFGLGITALTTSFGKYRFTPDRKPYTLFYFRGNRHHNIGVDYDWKINKLRLYGETAFSHQKGMGSLHALQLTPASYFSLLLLYRYYNKQYYTFFGNGFSESSLTNNEQGIYMGLTFTPYPWWKFSFYADLYRFPWLKYGIDSPSEGKEYMVQMERMYPGNNTFYVRYRYKQRDKNISTGEPSVHIFPYEQHRLRIQGNYFVRPFHFKTSLEGNINAIRSSSSKGYMIAHSTGWRNPKEQFQWDIFTAWFHTESYESRIFSREKNMAYVYGSGSFYGKGIRISGVSKWHISRKLNWSVKFSFVYYLDRETIGTGTEEIEGNYKSDIQTQIQWKF